MARNIRFKPKLRDTMLANAHLFQHLAAGAPPEKREAAERFAAEAMASVPPEPRRRAPKDGVDIDRIHGKPQELEAGVIAAISELLAHHPKVLIALRMNSGAASYEASTGRYAPVWFHRFLRFPEKMRMPDFIGFLVDGRPLAIEAKRPTWTRPRDDREREQAVYLETIRNIGGIGIFATSVDWVAEVLSK